VILILRDPDEHQKEGRDGVGELDEDMSAMLQETWMGYRRMLVMNKW